MEFASTFGDFPSTSFVCERYVCDEGAICGIGPLQNENGLVALAGYCDVESAFLQRVLEHDLKNSLVLHHEKLNTIFQRCPQARRDSQAQANAPELESFIPANVTSRARVPTKYFPAALHSGCFCRSHGGQGITTRVLHRDWFSSRQNRRACGLQPI